MAENAVVDAPDFDLVREESGPATEAAARTLWYVLNQEVSDRRKNSRRDNGRSKGMVLVSTVSVSQNNFDTQDALHVVFTDAGAFNITGLRNGEQGRMVLLWNIGAGTKTVKNASGSSDALNQIRTNSGGDVSIAQDKVVMLTYLNSLWREGKWA